MLTPKFPFAPEKSNLSLLIDFFHDKTSIELSKAPGSERKHHGDADNSIKEAYDNINKYDLTDSFF